MADNSNDTSSQNSFNLPASTKDIAQVLSLGLAAGALTVLLAELIQRFFINPVFCQNGGNSTYCGVDGLTGFYAATVIITVLSVVALARFGIFRPLLIAVGAAVALWGVKADLLSLGFIEYFFWVTVLFGLTYLLLYWLLRARNFVVSLVMVTVAVIALRLAVLA